MAWCPLLSSDVHVPGHQNIQGHMPRSTEAYLFTHSAPDPNQLQCGSRPVSLEGIHTGVGLGLGPRLTHQEHIHVHVHEAARLWGRNWPLTPNSALPSLGLLNVGGLTLLWLTLGGCKLAGKQLQLRIVAIHLTVCVCVGGGGGDESPVISTCPGPYKP